MAKNYEQREQWHSVKREDVRKCAAQNISNLSSKHTYSAFWVGKYNKKIPIHGIAPLVYDDLKENTLHAYSYSFHTCIYVIP